MLRLLNHGAGRFKKDKTKKTASDLAIGAGHLSLAGIVSADPKGVKIMEIAAQVRRFLLISQAASMNVVTTPQS